MGGEVVVVVVVALGVMGVVAPTSHPLPGSLALSAVALVAAAVQLRRALVVLVVLREVVLLLVVGGGRGGGVAPAALVQLAVPAEAVGGGDGLGATEASSAVVLTAPGRSCHRVLDAVAPVAAGARDGPGRPAAGARGRAGGRVALVEGLGRDAGQRHVAEAETHALRVEGLDLVGLALEQSPDSIRTLVLQGEHLLLDLRQTFRPLTDRSADTQVIDPFFITDHFSVLL